MTVAATITITRSDVGRFAIGPDRIIGQPMVVQILGRRPTVKRAVSAVADLAHELVAVSASTPR